MSIPTTAANSDQAHINAPIWPVTQGGAWYGLVVLMLAFLLAMIDRVILALLVDPIQRDLNISDTQFGLLNGVAFAFFYLFMAMPIARLADRTSRRRIIAIGVSVWSAMTASCGLAQTFFQLFVARMGVGVGEASLSPAAYSMLADMFPRDQIGRAYGIYNAGALIGFGASFVVGGGIVALVEQHHQIHLPLLGAVRSWQAVFMAVSLPGVLVALLVSTIREPPRGAAIAVDAAAPGELGQFLKSHVGILTLYFLAFGCLGMLLFGTLAWLPAVLTRSYGVSLATAGIALGIGIGIASPFGAVAGGMASDFLTARGRRDAPMIVGMCGAIGAFFFVVSAPVAPNWLLSVALTCGLFFCLTFPTSVGPAGLQMITPAPIRAQVTALYVIATGLAGMTTGSLAIGAITEHVFRTKAAVGLSIATFGAIVAPIMAVLFHLLRTKFARLNGHGPESA